jgi:rhamnulokinase
MPARIAAAATRRGQAGPDTPAAVVRCILDSLAAAYAHTVRRAAELASHDVETIHIVGGGCQNRLLCQLTADLSGLPVAAGPVEATALGNVLVQARALGAAPSSLEAIRAVLASTEDIRHYQPA